MEFPATAGILGSILAGACVALLVPVLHSGCVEMAKTVRARARLRSGGEAGGEGSRTLLQKAKDMMWMLLEGGIPMLSRACASMLRFESISRKVEPMAIFLKAKGCQASARTILECLLAGAVVAVALLWLATGSLIAGILICLAIAWAIAAAAGKWVSDRDARILEELPDALGAIGIYYESGLTLIQAFEQVSNEVSQPLAGMLGGVSEDMEAGKSVDEALARLRESTNIEAISFVTVSMEIQQRTGGAFQPLLDGAARSVSESLEMQRFMEVKTAQSRMSAQIVSILPVVLLLIMALINPEYISSFFTTPLGIGVLIVAIALETTGVLLVRKILDLDLG